MTEHEDISHVSLRSGKLGAVKEVILVTLYYIYRTSMLSFGGCLREPKPILRYTLDECLNVHVHRRTGRGGEAAGGGGGGGGPPPPPPPPPNFGQLRFFGQQEKSWAKPVFKDVSMFFY